MPSTAFFDDRNERLPLENKIKLSFFKMGDIEEVIDEIDCLVDGRESFFGNLFLISIERTCFFVEKRGI